MLYREIIALCSQIHTKHTNTLCGQNVELLNVKLAVYKVTTGLYRVLFLCILTSLWWTLKGKHASHLQFELLQKRNTLKA